MNEWMYEFRIVRKKEKKHQLNEVTNKFKIKNIFIYSET